jgi:hypothetical protein
MTPKSIPPINKAGPSQTLFKANALQKLTSRIAKIWSRPLRGWRKPDRKPTESACPVCARAAPEISINPVKAHDVINLFIN